MNTPEPLAVPAAMTLAAIIGFLGAATLFVIVARRDNAELLARIRSWWWIVGLLSAALLIGRTAMIVLFAFISFLAMKEYLSMIPTRRADRTTLFWVYLAIPLQYFWVSSAWYGMFVIFVPVYMFLALPALMVLHGETGGFLKAAGTLHWGLMTNVFAVSHAAYLLALPLENNPSGGGAGLLLFLLILTAFNDVAQYVSGKTFGRHKVSPKVSPNKTVEGLAGGLAATALLAIPLGLFLTPFTGMEAAMIGFALALAGFFGDVTVSAIKRDLNLKDSGSILPGHGGILDRIDSLTFTAPLFLHIFRYFYT